MNEVHVEMRVTNCRTVCRHCMVCGTTGDLVMPLNLTEKVLHQLRDGWPKAEFFPLDDLVAYPDWAGLLGLLNAYGLNSEVVTTTGAGGTFTPHMPLLRELGKNTLQLAFHGLEATHDQFVGAKGAFRDLLGLIRSGLSADFDIWIMIFLGKHNAKQVAAVTNLLGAMGIAIEDIGVTTPQYIGRSVASDKLRLTLADSESLPVHLQPRPRHFTETDWLAKVRTDATWDQPVFSGPQRRTELFVDSNMDVYLRNWNPYGMPGITGGREGFILGNLANEPLAVILKRYGECRPPYLRMFESISFMQLARRVGQPGQALYPHEDVPRYKWPYAFLKML